MKKRPGRFAAVLLTLALAAIPCSAAFATGPQNDTTTAPAGVESTVSGDAESGDSLASGTESGTSSASLSADASDADDQSAANADQNNALTSGNAADADEQTELLGSEAVEDQVAADAPEPKQNSPNVELLAVQNDVITSIEATSTSGGEVGDLSIWEQFLINVSFELPDGQVSAGDTTTIELPSEIALINSQPFEIRDSAGNLVANAAASASDKTITLTYTDYVENHSDVTGSFFFYVRIDQNVVTEETTIPLNFTVGNKTIFGGTVHYDGIGETTAHDLGKSGWPSNDSNQELNYSISVNRTKITMNDVVVRDQLVTEGPTYIRDSIEINKGTWTIINGAWRLVDSTDVTANYEVQWADDNRSFSIDLGNITPDEGFYITYRTQLDYVPVNGEVFENTASLSGSNIETKYATARDTIQHAGGSAEGYVFGIKVTKTDEKGEPLAGATFDVVRVANGATVGTITTDGSGEAQIGGLLRTSYQLVEVSAPMGYKLLTDPITVDPADFDSTTRIALVAATNELETVEVPVEKVWEGTPGTSAKIDLFADGTLVGSVELSSHNGWRHTFANLPKYDVTDAHEIVYTIAEEPIEGYTSEITGSADRGFIVTNTEVPEEPGDSDEPGEEPDDESDDGDDSDKAKKKSGKSVSPKTGDFTDALPFVLLLMVSGVAYVLTLRERRD